MERKEQIKQLIENVNRELSGVDLEPIQVVDDGWRYVIDAPEIDNVLEEVGDYLEEMPALKELVDSAVYDQDGQGFYYWIPYDQPPVGVTTPAMRFMVLK